MLTGKLWSTEEINYLISNLHLDTKDIYEMFSLNFGNVRTYDSVQKKVKSLRDLHKKDEELVVDLAPSEKPSTQTDSGYVQVAPAQSLVDIKEQTKAFLQGLRDLSGEDFSIHKKGIDSEDNPSLVVVLSDLHFGKQTDNFDMEVGAFRLTTMPARIAEMTEGMVFDEVVLILAGDVVEGEDIYASQNGVIESPVIEQAKSAVEAIWQAILNFAETFNCPVRVETSPGNHGRMSKTANVISNWDNVVYQMLGLVAHGAERDDVTVNVNFDFFKIFDVKGKKGMSYHYGTKHLGTPSMQVKFAGWIITHNIDFIVHGHWHHWGIETHLGRPMISNGSLPGPDDLSKSMAVEEAPRQSFFYVQKNKPLWGFSFVEW